MTYELGQIHASLAGCGAKLSISGKPKDAGATLRVVSYDSRWLCQQKKGGFFRPYYST